MQSSQETHGHTIAENMLYGYAGCRVISEEGKPFDFIHEEVNTGYGELTGLKNVLGRKMSEVMPEIAESNPSFVERLIRVSESGTPFRFDEYFEALNKWYDILVYSPQCGCLAAIFYDITGRKQAEKALKQSEERFRTLFNSHSAIQVLLDPDTGKVLDVNQEASEWYGWSVDELRQMYTCDVNTLPPEAIISSLQSVTGGKQNKYSGYHRRADGSIRDVEIFRNRIEIDGRAVIHVIVHDITDRKKAEMALQESEERFRSLFEDHSAIMIVLDPETGAIIDANKSAADFYGWGVDELRKMNIFNLNNSSYEAVQKEMEIWKMRDQRSMSFRHRRADGSIRNVDVFGKKIKIMGRELVYDIVHDVTLRHRLETVSQMRNRLLEMVKSHSVEELLRSTIDEVERLTDSSIGFGFLVEDDQASFIHKSYSTSTLKQMGEVHQREARSWLEKAGRWADIVRERRGVISNDYPSLTHRNVMQPGHIELQRELAVPVIRNQKIVAVLGVGNKPVDYDSDELALVSSFADQVWDIIENKIMDEEQKKLQSHIQQSAKMEMIGQLAAGIAHEINNPLNFITLNAYNLREDFKDLYELVSRYRLIIEKVKGVPTLTEDIELLHDKEREFDVDELLKSIPAALEKSQNGVERIKTITHSMRSYSFKNVLEQLKPFDLNKAIHEALVIAKSEYLYIATITLKLEELPQFICDPSQINQVILNLIINSIHAIKSQNRSSLGNVEIKTWATAENVCCSITDDGIGISEELKERIFEPFFTTKEPGKGTGLGLNISYDIIVKKHEGRISVDSSPESGTTFTFSLPIIKPVEMLDHARQAN